MPHKPLGTVFLLFVTLVVALAPAATQAGELSGTWRGSGWVYPKASNKERVKCRVTYRPQSAKVVSVKAICATASAKIIQTGELLKVRKGLYVGDFYNAQFDISGRIRMTMSGRRQSVTFSGAQGRGSLTLRR